MRFVLSSDPRKLAAAIANQPSATVEAEYGDALVEGSVLTMAHHGPRTGQKAAPSLASSRSTTRNLSHKYLESIATSK